MNQPSVRGGRRRPDVPRRHRGLLRQRLCVRTGRDRDGARLQPTQRRSTWSSGGGVVSETIAWAANTVPGAFHEAPARCRRERVRLADGDQRSRSTNRGGRAFILKSPVTPTTGPDGRQVAPHRVRRAGRSAAPGVPCSCSPPTRGAPTTRGAARASTPAATRVSFRRPWARGTLSTGPKSSVTTESR